VQLVYETAPRYCGPAVEMNDSVDFLVGQTVEQIWVWGPFRLLFDSREPQVYVDVEGTAHLTRDGEGAEINFFTEGNAAEAAKLLSLLWKRVAGARIENGVLRLSFDNGAALSAFPSERYESWHALGNGRAIFCLPGGGIGTVG
jgi:Family of unknown function (DUF6188)